MPAGFPENHEVFPSEPRGPLKILLAQRAEPCYLIPPGGMGRTPMEHAVAVYSQPG